MISNSVSSVVYGTDSSVSGEMRRSCLLSAVRIMKVNSVQVYETVRLTCTARCWSAQLAASQWRDYLGLV